MLLAIVRAQEASPQRFFVASRAKDSGYAWDDVRYMQSIPSCNFLNFLVFYNYDNYYNDKRDNKTFWRRPSF